MRRDLGCPRTAGPGGSAPRAAAELGPGSGEGAKKPEDGGRGGEKRRRGAGVPQPPGGLGAVRSLPVSARLGAAGPTLRAFRRGAGGCPAAGSCSGASSGLRGAALPAAARCPRGASCGAAAALRLGSAVGRVENGTASW